MIFNLFGRIKITKFNLIRVFSSIVDSKIFLEEVIWEIKVVITPIGASRDRQPWDIWRVFSAEDIFEVFLRFFMLKVEWISVGIWNDELFFLEGNEAFLIVNFGSFVICV